MSVLRIGRSSFEWGARTYVMGILNVTPDSFSGDGLLSRDSAAPIPETASDPDILEKVRFQAQRFLASGVDILDVGGESTRPGSREVSAEEELERVLPVIRMLSSQFPDAIVSIDTYKSIVAAQALEAGAHLVNDVWGFRGDPLLAGVVASRQAPVILMHNRSKPSNAQVQENLGGRYIGMKYDDLLQDVKNELMDSVGLARQVGIPADRIILDPGIGFGKTVEQNLELLNRLGEIRALGFPVLLGPSRKSFIGYTLNLPPDQRVEGTAAAVSVGITRGADLIRVHDVETMVRVARMTDAIVRPTN